MKQVSIVIPTYNRVELLPHTVKWLANQMGGIDYEVIFVINGANDGTREYLERVAREQPAIFGFFISTRRGVRRLPATMEFAERPGR